MNTAEVFESHRPRLLGVANRLLGSRADAEDLVQDAYLRWHQCPREDIQSPVAWLVTTTTHLCLDRLRRLKLERPAGMASDASVEEAVDSPESRHELADEVAAAFGIVLERLGREERMAFLLRDVFDFDYPEMARLLGKSEAACRQVIRRARLRLSEPVARFRLSRESRERLLQKFLDALSSGDRREITALLAEADETAAERKPQTAWLADEPETIVEADDGDEAWQPAAPWWIHSRPGGQPRHNGRGHGVLQVWNTPR